MWNDRDTPVAYLITFRCYGTWLHGDNRGSVNKFNNKFLSPFIKSNKSWEAENNNKLKGEVVILNAEQRTIVEETIREVCKFKDWVLHALNVRTNHVHIVVSTGNHSVKSALNAFKAYSTRNLRKYNLWNLKHSPWSDKGSQRYLWNEKSLETAIEYVVSKQGSKLPDFD
ncbi:MAG: transposase [Pyrinomonadaceae bacterium]